MKKNNTLTFKASIVTFGKAVEKIIIIVLYIILSRFLSKDDYGTFRQFLLIVSTISSIFIFGLPASLNYFLPKYSKLKQKSIVIQTFITLIIIGFICSSIVFFLSNQLSNLFNNSHITILSKWIAISIFATLPISIYHNFFIMVNKANINAILSISFGFLRLFVILIAVLKYATLKGIIIAFTIVSLTQLFVVLLLIVSHFKGIKLFVSVKLWLNQLKFAYPIGLALIVGLFVKKMDQLMVSMFFTRQEYAIYANGAFEIPLMAIITNSILVVLMPFFVKTFERKQYDEFVKKWKKSIISIAIIIIPITVFLIFYSEEFISIMFSKKYLQSSDIFRLYLLINFARLTIFGNILLSMGQTKVILYFSSLTLLLNLVLNLILIKILGIIGPAISTVISIYFINFLQLKFISVKLHYRLDRIWPWKKLCILILICIVITSVTIILKSYVENPIGLILSAGTFFTFIYTYIVFKKYKQFLPKFLLRSKNV